LQSWQDLERQLSEEDKSENLFKAGVSVKLRKSPISVGEDIPLLITITNLGISPIPPKSFFRIHGTDYNQEALLLISKEIPVGSQNEYILKHNLRVKSRVSFASFPERFTFEMLSPSNEVIVTDTDSFQFSSGKMKSLKITHKSNSLIRTLGWFIS
jgi:hypothetical protein